MSILLLVVKLELLEAKVSGEIQQWCGFQRKFIKLVYNYTRNLFDFYFTVQEVLTLP